MNGLTLRPSNLRWPAARASSSALLLSGACALAGGGLGACEDDGSIGDGELTLQGESELFPSFDFSTGLQPPGSPVQASFSVTAGGVARVNAVAIASGDESSPTLTGVPDRGTLGIEGSFGMIGELRIDIDGLPSYEGPIPGIENVSIPIGGSAAFSPFSIGKAIVARADIPPTDLPGIPLPGGIPGQLVLTVAEGSFVEIGFEAGCAGIDGSTARYTGSIARAGTLVIRPSIEIEVPFVGTQTFDVPELSVDLALGSSNLEASAKIASFGSEPEGGDSVSGSCEPRRGHRRQWRRRKRRGRRGR